MSATHSRFHRARVRKALIGADVAKLEDRPCRYCKGPIGTKLLRAIACSKEECQHQRIRETNRAACRRYYRKGRADVDALVLETRTQLTPPRYVGRCARCNGKREGKNRMLCNACFKNEDRGT